MADRITAPYVAELVQLTDYEEIVEVLRSPAFRQGAFTLSGPAMLRDTVSTLHGKHHFERRRIEAKLFSQAALERYRRTHLLPMVDRALAGVVRRAGGQRPVRAELVDLTWTMLCQVAGSLVGLDGITDDAVIKRLVGYTRRFGEALTVEWSTGDQVQIIRDGLAARAEYEKDLFADSAARRRELVARFKAGDLPAEQLPTDLITMLYLHWNDDWDDELPLRESTMYLVAATQTTVQAFPHFILHLERWFAEDPRNRARIAAEPELLRHAAFESLRLFVASPVRIREATEDVTLSTGRRFRAGDRVGLLLQAANTSERVFGPDAGQYNPLRDISSRSRWGLAFGGGPHMCIGRPLVTGVYGADIEGEGTLSTMARRLYAAGLRLDPDHAPERDPSTYYDAYRTVPVIFDHPDAL